VAEPVRARRLSDAEGQRLTQIVRRGKGGSIRVRRATMIMASASGTPVPAIARLVAADEETVRDVIHDFNATRCGCPRRTTAPTPIRYFHGCYSLGDDQLWGITRRRKGGTNTLAALQSIRRGPDLRDHGHLSANKTPAIRTWAARNKVELCFTPTYASWANPIEAQFGPLRTFTMGATNHPNHPALARRLQAYLRWRNQNARHPDVLAAQRRERARIRSERHQRWGRPRQAA